MAELLDDKPNTAFDLSAKAFERAIGIARKTGLHKEHWFSSNLATILHHGPRGAFMWKYLLLDR